LTWVGFEDRDRYDIDREFGTGINLRILKNIGKIKLGIETAYYEMTFYGDNLNWWITGNAGAYAYFTIFPVLGVIKGAIYQSSTTKIYLFGGGGISRINIGEGDTGYSTTLIENLQIMPFTGVGGAEVAHKINSSFSIQASANYYRIETRKSHPDSKITKATQMLGLSGGVSYKF
jgi:hypothetical protein